jgi:hypothetical protein
MFPAGGLRAEKCPRKICGSAAPRDPLAERVHGDPAKGLVMLHIGQLVGNGFAEWVASGNGDIELTLSSGEVFHLGEESITRIA